MTYYISSCLRVSAMSGLLFVSACANVWEPAPDAVFFAHQAKARVYPVAATEAEPEGFEVAPPIGAGAESYWCAAADYARRALGAGWNDKIYVQRGRGVGPVSGRVDAVVFTLSPVERAAPKPLLNRPYAFLTGDAYSVSVANGQCGAIEWRFPGAEL